MWWPCAEEVKFYTGVSLTLKYTTPVGRNTSSDLDIKNMRLFSCSINTWQLQKAGKFVNINLAHVSKRLFTVYTELFVPNFSLKEESRSIFKSLNVCQTNTWRSRGTKAYRRILPVTNSIDQNARNSGGNGQNSSMFAQEFNQVSAGLPMPNQETLCCDSLIEYGNKFYFV